MNVIKRDGTIVPFDFNKIKNAVNKAFNAVHGGDAPEEFIDYLKAASETFEEDKSVEDIQKFVIYSLGEFKWFDVQIAYIEYKKEHDDTRFVRERMNYMDGYAQSNVNAASSSETDANSNVAIKNVANLEGEVYKTTNRLIQRSYMKDELNESEPGLGKQYIEDLEHCIIYTHDEASTPTKKFYCQADTLYPLMTDGVGNVDGVTPLPPNDIASFSGQVTNFVFISSSQCKGAVALGDYFIALNYYVIAEFGPKGYERLDEIVTTGTVEPHDVKYYIRKGMKQFIYGVNQPAGNRSFNSPFSNLSYYDSEYFNSLFGEFYYPDGTQPEGKAIDTLQRMFMQLHRELRLIKPLTFPVTTMALVYNDKDYIDLEYKNLCAEEGAKGGSFFCFNSNNPTALASCCRVLNEISDNTFSSTTGMTGVMTGSCNVITLNFNRIIQDGYRMMEKLNSGGNKQRALESYADLQEYIIEILERVYRYHIAYKTMLYDLEDKGMFTVCNANYIRMSKLYSTVGLLGYFEAAKFLGLSTTYNKEYINFLGLLFGTVREENKKHSIHDRKRPFIFNSEAVPGENLGVKFYEGDKRDNYGVPEDQNLYNCYFYNPGDDTSVLDKMRLHGRKVSQFTDGGQACHINLDSHLSKEQYLKLMDFARENGTNYYTFNIPMSECNDCHHTVNAPITECPKCKSKNISYGTRIIGYLTKVDNWSKARQIEQKQRTYTEEKDVKIS